MLIGFAYIGHAGWVFDGYSSALTVGCRNADILLVDSGMIPFLSKDWMTTAARKSMCMTEKHSSLAR